MLRQPKTFYAEIEVRYIRRLAVKMLMSDMSCKNDLTVNFHAASILYRFIY